MNRMFWYFISMLVLFLVFRFFGIIMVYAIRFWFISIPLVLLLLYYLRKKRSNKSFNSQTGLDPGKEVKLKQEPEIKIDEDENE